MPHARRTLLSQPGTASHAKVELGAWEQDGVLYVRVRTTYDDRPRAPRTCAGCASETRAPRRSPNRWPAALPDSERKHMTIHQFNALAAAHLPYEQALVGIAEFGKRWLARAVHHRRRSANHHLRAPFK